MSAHDPIRRICPRCCATFRGSVGHCPRDGASLLEADRDPLVNRVLRGGRYRIRAVAGEGSAGRVYLADDLHDDRACAIKVLFGELAAMPDVMQRFRREADAARLLDHPNVVSVYDAGFEEVGEPLFLVMDYVAGATLRARVHTHGRLDIERARAILRGVTAGLAHAHDHGVLHRDLKPSNIILSEPDDQPRLVDFGVSRVLHAEAQAPLTSYGRVVGTPGFIAPEVLRGQSPDFRSDLYGLGVTAYFTLTGDLPFEAGIDQAISKTLAGLELTKLDDRIPPDLQAWVRSLLELAPEDRPQDAATAHQALPRPAPALLSVPAGLKDQHGDTVDESVANLHPGPEPSGPRFDIEPRAALVAVFGAITLGTLILPSSTAVVTPSSSTPHPASVWERPSAEPASDVGLRLGATAVQTPTRIRSLEPDSDLVEPDEPTLASTTIPVAERLGSADALAPPARERKPPKSKRSRARRPASDGVSSPPPKARRRSDRRSFTKSSRSAPKQVSAEHLVRRYKDVGLRLEALGAEKSLGELHRRYLDIAIADAIRRPERREEVFQRLQRIARDLKRAERLKEPRP